MRNKKQKEHGFSLVELFVTIAIIGTLSALILVAMVGVREKARDAKRKAHISQMGKVLTMSCFMPSPGPGEYDLYDIASERATQNPSYQKYLNNLPFDPKIGSLTRTFYIYAVSADGKNCALWANLENENEKITVSGTQDPAPGLGIGILEGVSDGANGTKIYHIYSN